METIGLVFALTILTEGIVEYLGTSISKQFKPYVAALLSMTVCVLYNADLLAMLGYTALVPYTGAVLTGLMIGRGSNYVNDVISRLNVVRTPAKPVGQVLNQPAQNGGTPSIIPARNAS
jgi:hypothetical protein